MDNKTLINMALKHAGKSESWLAREMGYTKQYFNQVLRDDRFGDGDIQAMMDYIKASYKPKSKKVVLHDGVFIDWSKS